MTAHNFNLRDIPDPVFTLLKIESTKQKISIKTLITRLIEQSLGYTHIIKRATYHDLDSLAGIWSKKDVIEFKKTTAFLEKNDNEL